MDHCNPYGSLFLERVDEADRDAKRAEAMAARYDMSPGQRRKANRDLKKARRVLTALRCEEVTYLYLTLLGRRAHLGAPTALAPEQRTSLPREPWGDVLCRLDREWVSGKDLPISDGGMFVRGGRRIFPGHRVHHGPEWYPE